MLPVSIDGYDVLPFHKLARVETSCCLKKLLLIVTENVYRYYEVFVVSLFPWFSLHSHLARIAVLFTVCQ